MTRFPVVGKCKTRLAKKIGDRSATLYQRLFTEKIVSEAKMYAEKINKREREMIARVWVFHKGGTKEEMARWLGEERDDFCFVEQCSGDLGDILRETSRLLFTSGGSPSTKVVIVGSDIPSISSETFEQAFHSLSRSPPPIREKVQREGRRESAERERRGEENVDYEKEGGGDSVVGDLVMGPTHDGGYYLIGMNRQHFPQTVFSFIRWSSEHTLKDTVSRFEKFYPTGRVEFLSFLRDIDESEDLEMVQSDSDVDVAVLSVVRPIVSVVMPVLNEERQIASVLERLSEIESADRLDVIIVDGGSSDQTLSAIDEWVKGKLGGAGERDEREKETEEKEADLPPKKEKEKKRIPQKEEEEEEVLPFFRLHIVRATRQGRGHQMNEGAAEAMGSIFLFLHADTKLSLNGVVSLWDCLSDVEVRCGAFRFGLYHDDGHLVDEWSLICLLYLVDFRSCWFGMPYGDQAFFMTGELIFFVLFFVFLFFCFLFCF